MEKFNKINKTLLYWLRKKIQVTNIRNEKDVISYLTKIKRIIREYHEHVGKIDNIDKMNNSLKNTLLKLAQEKIEKSEQNYSKYKYWIINKNNYTQRKVQAQGASLENSDKHLERINTGVMSPTWQHRLFLTSFPLTRRKTNSYSLTRHHWENSRTWMWGWSTLTHYRDKDRLN